MNISELGIDRMSVAERLELIDQIWDTLPEQFQIADIPDWHLQEIAARREELDRSIEPGEPWRQVLARLESRQ